MRMVALLVVSLPMVLAPGCGCGGGGSGDVPFNRLADGYAAAFCHKNFVCCDAAETGVAAAEIPAKEALCRTNLANEWAVFVAPYAPLIAQGRIIYRGDRARLCFDEIAAKPCAESGDSGELRLYPDCLHIYEGTIALGGACTVSDECMDGFCSSSTGTGACTAYGRIGESCGGGACQPELFCARDASGATMVCATPSLNGATCVRNSDCASAFCDASVCAPPTLCNGV